MVEVTAPDPDAVRRGEADPAQGGPSAQCSPSAQSSRSPQGSQAATGSPSAHDSPSASSSPPTQSSPSASALDVLILRDPRESSAKCSLTPLRGFAGVRFLTWKHDRRFDVGRRLLLHADGEEISDADADLPLLLIDCAWRRVPTLLASCDGDLTLRRLPKLATAYPRKSLTFVDPEQGLASIEALYAALALLGQPRADLLSSYRWAEGFLAANPGLPRDR